MKKYILFSLLTVSSYVQAQTLHLKNATFTPSENIRSVTHFEGWNNFEHENLIYAIVQFNKSISAQERQKIEAETGIKFYDYIPRWAFLATLPSQINPSSLSKYGIKSVLPNEANYKITKSLSQRPFPHWIVKENGAIEILVDVFPSISKEAITAILIKENCIIENWESVETFKTTVQPNQLNTIANLPWVKLVQPTSAPAVYENLTERSNHRVNTIDAAYVTGLHFDGTGISVSVGDDGVVGPHIDFRGRLIHHTTNDGGTHADHVVGIVGGGGNFDPVTSGNGRGADLHIYSNYGNITNANADYNTDGVRILTNSLGQGCNDGYTNNSKTLDALIRSKESLLSVHSSGNSGNTSCGGVSQGFFTITGGYKAGKNAIATGNVLNDDALAPSSSRGPSEDGRLKPEIVAVGTDVYSTQPDNTYDSFTGTSMAAPGAAGTLASLYHAYKATHSGADPYSGLMKALLLNSADDLGNKGPDFRYGYGRINARKAFQTMSSNQFKIDSVDNGIMNDFTITVPNNVSQMKVMLYWHDVDGNPSNSIVLVNDLNLTVEDDNAVIFQPLVLNNAPNVAALNAVAVPNRDSLNNSEQVVIDLPQAGVYTIHVDGYDVPVGPQKYVVVYEFLTEQPTLIYPRGGESFLNGVSERIRWDAYGDNLGTFKVEYSSDAGASWNTISNAVQANRRYVDWTPLSTLNTGQMLVKVTRGTLSDESDTLFTVLGRPTGLVVDTACGNTFHLKWNALAGAEGYKIFMLGNKYMEEIGTSTTNEFYVSTGVNLTDTFYFAVSATKASNGANGLRTIAYRKLPGEINCLDDLANVETTIPFNNVYNCASSATVPISVKIKNTGFRNVTNIPIYYQINAGVVVSEVINTTLLVGDSITYTFNNLANLSAAGSYTIKTWTYLFADVNHANDSSEFVATIFAPTLIAAPTTEDFEGVAFPPTGWRIIDLDTNVKWQKTLNLQGANSNNTHSAYMDFFNYYSKQAIDDLETAQFDLTNVTTDSVLITFDVAHAYTSENDTLSVLVSNDCTTNFYPTNYKKWGANLATAGMMSTIFSPTLQNQWRKDQADLSAYKGQKVFVRFRGSNAHGNNVYIDNVNITLKNFVPLSIANANVLESMLVYPNPSNGIYTLTFNSLAKKVVEYSIYNIAGQLIQQNKYSLNVGSNQFELNIESFPDGVYMLDLTENNHTKHIKLLNY